MAPERAPKDPPLAFYPPSSTRSLSPNQFALPGMERRAHPLAKYVARGFSFEESEFRTPHREPGNYQATHYHMLAAHHPEAGGWGGDWSQGRHVPDTQVAELNWHGEGSEAGVYPGEISWVNRTARPAGSSRITDAMHRFALQGGKSTVPVHSTDRSWEGDEWAKRVGPKRLTPQSFEQLEQEHSGRHEIDDDQSYDEAWQRLYDARDRLAEWRPPKGTHPYERLAGAQFRSPKPARGQGRLFRKSGRA